MASDREFTSKTTADRWLTWVSNNRAIAALIVAGAILGPLESVTGMFGAAYHYLWPSAPAQLTAADLEANPGCVPMRIDQSRTIIDPYLKDLVIAEARSVLRHGGRLTIKGISNEGTQAFARGEALRRARSVEGLFREANIPVVEIYGMVGSPHAISTDYFCGAWFTVDD